MGNKIAAAGIQFCRNPHRQKSSAALGHQTPSRPRLEIRMTNNSHERGHCHNPSRNKRRLDSIQRCDCHGLPGHRGMLDLHDFCCRLLVLPWERPRWADAETNARTSNSEHGLHPVEQRDHDIGRALVEKRRHETLQFLVAGDHCTRGLLSARARRTNGSASSTRRDSRFRQTCLAQPITRSSACTHRMSS